MSLLRRLSAFMALAAFASGFGLPWAAAQHFTPGDDSACGEVALGSGYSTTQFESVPPPVAPEHCALCHWRRAVSGSQPTAVMEPCQPDGVPVRIVFYLPSLGVVAHREGPARAPPARVAYT